MIPYGRQSISQEDLAAVEAVLRSDWLTQGPAVPRFEAAVASLVGAKHAVAMNSATSALHVACVVLGVGPGSRVWTVPNTFVASANCARYCGASIDFVDIDPLTYCIDPADLARRLARARDAGALPDVVVCVDFAGQPCDYDAIAALKAEYGFRVIDDASHAIGARFGASHIGALPVADITVFSFHPVKIVTSAEGGMLVTADATLGDAARRLRSHGIERDPAKLEQADQGGWYYEQQALGWNYRITDLQAALGCSQLARIGAFLQRRRAIAKRYDALLAGIALQRPAQRAGCESAFHLYPVLLRDASQRRQVYDHLRHAGIGVQVHYLPVHLQPYYRAMGFAEGDFPVAEDYAARTLSLPIYADLSDEAQDRVIAALKVALA